MSDRDKQRIIDRLFLKSRDRIESHRIETRRSFERRQTSKESKKTIDIGFKALGVIVSVAAGMFLNMMSLNMTRSIDPSR